MIVRAQLRSLVQTATRALDILAGEAPLVHIPDGKLPVGPFRKIEVMNREEMDFLDDQVFKDLVGTSVSIRVFFAELKAFAPEPRRRRR